MVFRWWANGGPTLNAGLIALWFYNGSKPELLKPFIFVIFQEGCPEPLSPSLDPRMWAAYLSVPFVLYLVLTAPHLVFSYFGCFFSCSLCFQYRSVWDISIKSILYPCPVEVLTLLCRYISIKNNKVKVCDSGDNFD